MYTRCVIHVVRRSSVVNGQEEYEPQKEAKKHQERQPKVNIHKNAIFFEYAAKYLVGDA